MNKGVYGMIRGNNMSEQENVKVIRELFAAQGEGDLDRVLIMIAEKVDWQSPATRTNHTEITWVRLRQSRDEVVQYIKELGSVVLLKNPKFWALPLKMTGLWSRGEIEVLSGLPIVHMSTNG